MNEAATADEILQDDERLLWSGAPSDDRLLMRIDYLLIPAGIAFAVLGFASLIASLMGLAGGNGGLWVFTVISLLVLWAAWEMIAGHLIRRRRKALRTHYLLTDRRVISMHLGDTGREVRAVEFADVPPLRVRPQYEERSTIVVGDVTLFNIRGGIRVESLIRQQLPAASSPAP